MKFDVLFQKVTPGKYRPLPFLLAVGTVLVENCFIDSRLRSMKKIGVATKLSRPGEPEKWGPHQAFIFDRSRLGRFRHKRFFGTAITITRYALRWKFRGRSYCVTSRGVKSKPVRNSQRRN